jgi:hypothetical protein
MTKVLDAYIRLGVYCHSLVIETDDDYIRYIKIHSTGVKSPPIDASTLKGKQMLWVLGQIAGKKDIGEFPRA